MSRYATNTTVSTENSMAEIRSILRRYKADAFGYKEDTTNAQVHFKKNGLMIRFDVAMPKRDDPKYTHTLERGTARTEEAAFEEWDKACRQRWRALVLIIKAKLEGVESGITSFEQEFLGNILLPAANGEILTVWEVMSPKLLMLTEGLTEGEEAVKP